MITQMRGWLFQFYLIIEDYKSYDLLNKSILGFKQQINREVVVEDIEVRN